MAGISNELHICIFSFFPYLPLFYFFLALCKERTVSGAFVCAESFSQFKVMISDDGIYAETLGYGALIPG